MQRQMLLLLFRFSTGYASGQVGTVIAGISVEFVTTGLSSSTNVGNVTVQANADAIVTGEEVSGNAGNVRVYGQVIPVQNPSFQPPVPGTQPGDPLSSPAYKATSRSTWWICSRRSFTSRRMERRSIGELYGEYVYNKLCD